MILQSSACYKEWADCDAAVETMLTPRFFDLVDKECELCQGKGGSEGNECDCILLGVYDEVLEAYVSCEGESIQGAEFRCDISNLVKSSPGISSLLKNREVSMVLQSEADRRSAIQLAKLAIERKLYPIPVPRRNTFTTSFYLSKEQFYR